MRIGIDCRLWNESGVGRYTRNLVCQLQKLDKKNEYVLFVRSTDYENFKFQISNFKFQIRKADIKWHTIKEQLLFPSILNRENLDLVHFPYFSVPIFYNRPFVVTIHDLIINHFPTGQATTLPRPLYRLKLLGYKLIISQAAKKAKKIITVSEATKREIVDHLGVSETKVRVTYEGVDQKNSNLPTSLKLRGAGKIQNQFRLGQNFFLYVGNAYPHKNLDQLLQALKILISSPRGEAGQYPNISLILVGKEDYFYKRLKEKVKEMDLEDSVVFYGEANDEELRDLYQHAQALVIPSLMEGFGLPALEAMSQGCLVLCSDIASLREVCGEAAIYFDPLNIEDIAEKIRQVCYHDLNHSIKIQDGRERAKTFSWEKMAKETLKIYNASY